MKTLITGILIAMLTAGSCLANDIWGHDGDFMDDDVNAKVHRNVAKQRALEANMTAEELEESQKNRKECGSLDVGNVQGGGKDVNNVTVIKGDVINFAGKCRSTR